MLENLCLELCCAIPLLFSLEIYEYIDKWVLSVRGLDPTQLDIV